MDFEVARGKPLTRDETKVLLDLIENSPVIMSKNTTATSNQLKKEEWSCMAKLFNGSPRVLCHRTPQQLRLKWENLKKNCRRRNTKIKLASIASSDGAPVEIIHPDIVLDRVAEILQRKAQRRVPLEGYIKNQPGDGSSSDGLSEEFNYNEDQNSMSMDNNESMSLSETKENTNASLEVPIDNFIEVSGGRSQIRPCQSSARIFPRRGKKKVIIGDRGRTARNLAIAEYYKTKKKCLNAKLENLLLENKKFELENKKLILEIIQLTKK